MSGRPVQRLKPAARRPNGSTRSARRIDGARTLARDLLRRARSGALATLGRDGHPAASLVSVATDSDGTPLILVSALSGHTGNLLADPRCSLLLASSGKGDPLAHPRLTLTLRARQIARETPEGPRIRRRFLARQPEGRALRRFRRFRFFRARRSRAPA